MSGRATSVCGSSQLRRRVLWGMYSEDDGLFLVHFLAPSRTPGQVFDIFIYLRKHKSTTTPEVAYAEFFLGRHWGNQVFKLVNNGGLFGLATSAFGEFLCLCSVSLRDGKRLLLHRYIDFGSFVAPE
jgi:hypothetical protein